MALLKFKIRVKDLVGGGFFEVGETYDIKENARVERIVNKGWGDISKDGNVFGVIDLTDGVIDIAKSVAEEQDINNVLQALDAESKKDIPRKTVINALNICIAKLSENKQIIELADGESISIAKGIAYGEDNGKTVVLATGEYRSKTHIYTVGDNGEVSVTEIPE
jgi:hypothetical protein